MIRLIEPLKKVILEDTVYECEEVQEQLFGGFCDCGGLMFQKLWFEKNGEKILISECEKCWKNEARIFVNFNFVGKQEVEVLGRYELIDFLKNLLTKIEFEALLKKARDSSFQSMALSNARKKLSSMNFNFEEILNVVR
ncbi:hypothetical protein [Archaeoglobus neptunius]|uniref:hypothetical protein n=1 Tax=Archaeoglobus neptunius TaxID=2798580 RepID=UPI001929566D|nr:hypothetical protein [Archaeoglobus neptunius]